MIKKFLKIAGIGIFAVFIVIQLFRPARTNPPVLENEKLQSSTVVPIDVESILNRSCSDCHSNETRYPWYSHVAPFSWSVVDHVIVGRGKLNFSKWGTYPLKKQKHKLEEMCDEVVEGEMPHYQYLWLHREAALTDVDIRILCDWTIAERKRLSAK